MKLIIFEIHNNLIPLTPSLARYRRDRIQAKATAMFQMLDESLPSNFSEYRGMRNNIVHGTKTRDVDQIRLVSEKIEGVKSLAQKILLEVMNNHQIQQIVLSP